MHSLEIKITEILPSTLGSREAAIRLFNVIKEESKSGSKIVTDFADTLYMSRSFADQFHKDLYTGESILDITIKNASNDILAMLPVVSNTPIQGRAVNNNYRNLSFDHLKSLEEFSFSW